MSYDGSVMVKRSTCRRMLFTQKPFPFSPNESGTTIVFHYQEAPRPEKAILKLAKSMSFTEVFLFKATIKTSVTLIHA